MAKKLAVFFDGTWNTPESRTNVHRLYKLLNELDLEKQQAVYISGVGTETSGLGLLDSVKKFLGGAFGDGLSETILQGYRWLINTYQEGDDIFLFGFSRGAYSARSLAGLIRNCGVLRKEHANRAKDAYAIYRDRLPPDTEKVKQFRHDYAYEPDIAFMGVWDTVGSLGIPVNGIDFPGFKEHYLFHDTRLSSKVRRAYHALAINEYRLPYAPTFWTGDSGERPLEEIEQRWFIGAHSNVGGGYPNDTLCDLPCRWVQRMAQQHGLQFLSDWPVKDNSYLAPPNNSYEDMLKEHPEASKVIHWKARTIGAATTLNETVDSSVIQRIEKDSAFLVGKKELETLKDGLLKLRRGS